MYTGNLSLQNQLFIPLQDYKIASTMCYKPVAAWLLKLPWTRCMTCLRNRKTITKLVDLALLYSLPVQLYNLSVWLYDLPVRLYALSVQLYVMSVLLYGEVPYNYIGLFHMTIQICMDLYDCMNLYGYALYACCCMVDPPS